MSTQGYEPKHRASRVEKTAKERHRGFTVMMVASLLVGASLIYAPAYGFSGLLGDRVSGENAVAEQGVEPKVTTEVDRIQEFETSKFDNSGSEVAPTQPTEPDPGFIVDFTDVYGTDSGDFTCHDDSFDGGEPDSL